LSNVIYFSDNEDEITNAAAVKSLEVEGVKAAESGDLDTAIGLFTRAINVAPKWASGYNNRAQAYRLKGDTAGMRYECLEACPPLPPSVTQCAILRSLSVLSTREFSPQQCSDWLWAHPPSYFISMWWYSSCVFRGGGG
jgi:tetratricopeptide (TPR) repeat protein